MVHESVDFSSMTITETKSSKLAVQTLKTSELSLKWRTVVFTVARGFPELAKTLDRLNCVHSEYWRGYQSKF